jgi:hypothetical protein
MISADNRSFCKCRKLTDDPKISLLPYGKTPAASFHIDQHQWPGCSSYNQGRLQHFQFLATSTAGDAPVKNKNDKTPTA